MRENFYGASVNPGNTITKQKEIKVGREETEENKINS